MAESLTALRPRATASNQNPPPFFVPGASVAPVVVAFAGPEGPGLGKNRISPPPAYQKHRSTILRAVASRLSAGYFHEHSENLPGSSVCGCGRWKSFGGSPGVAEIAVTPGTATMAGHFVCGNGWTCEPCATTKVAHYRSWIRAALLPALEAQDLACSLVTLTLAHRYADDWAQVVRSLIRAWKLADKRLAKAYRRAGSIGKFKATEVVIGRNGIHPHFHILVTHAKDADLAALADDMRSAWMQAVDEVGGVCNDRGFDFSEDAAADYVAKMETAHELASQSTKQGRRKGRSLTQTLVAASRGDLRAGAEWQRAIKALDGIGRFTAGGLSKKLGIECPTKWEDPERKGASEDESEATIISYPLQQHLDATHPATGRPGLAMILRAARRAGLPGVLRMTAALCKEYEAKRPKPMFKTWMDYVQEPDPGDFIDQVGNRPIRPNEVSEYLRAIGDRATKKRRVPA